MNEAQYRRLSRRFRKQPWKNRLLGANRITTYLCYLLYPLLLVLLALQRDIRFWRVLAVPAASFVILSLVRMRINRPRPYQTLDIEPLIPKNTLGKSMPSRHVFSVFMIAACYLWVYPIIGIGLLAVGVLVGAIRVIGGVHYPSDVVVGALVGLGCGAIGFLLL